jgi:hypothetical protein
VLVCFLYKILLPLHGGASFKISVLQGSVGVVVVAHLYSF